MWQGLSYEEETDENYIAELEALSHILAVLVVRDLRLILLPETIGDARERLREDRYRARRVALIHFEHAINHFADPHDDRQASLLSRLELPESVLTEALEHIPAGLDRMMVRAAVHSGAHVFLSRDAGITAARQHFRQFKLYLGTPMDVLEELAASGALNCLFDPRLMLWPLPDQHRIGHLIEAALDYTPINQLTGSVCSSARPKSAELGAAT